MSGDAVRVTRRTLAGGDLQEPDGREGARLRGLAVWLAGGVLLAVITGPSGDSEDPLAGVRGSLFAPRIGLFLGMAVAGWACVLSIGRLRTRFAARLAALAARRAPSMAQSWFRGRSPQGRSPQGRSPQGPCRRVTVGSFAGSDQAAVPLQAEPQKAEPLKIATNAALLAVALFLPLGLSTAAVQALVTDIGIYALLALGLNVVVGYAGLLDLGYIAFFAIGAYTTAYFTSDTAMPWHSPVLLNPFVVFPIAVAVAMAAGVALGGPTLRLRGDYLAIVTLGFGEIVQLLANNAEWVTGGSRGVFGVPPLSFDVAGISYAWGLRPLPYYYLLLVIVLGVMVVFGRLERSHIGRAWAAIREDEFAAGSCGVATTRMKLLAFAIGASVSGFAGVLFATKQFFSPQTFSLQASILVLTVVIFGGMGSRLGVVMGAVVLQGTAYVLRDVVPPTDRYIYFGVVVMVMMTFRPQGLLPPGRRERAVAGARDDAGVPGMGGVGDAVPVGGPAG